MADGEMTVLFESKTPECNTPECDQLQTARIQHVQNKELVEEYLAKMEYIPHIKTVITMEPTAGLRTEK